MKEIGVSIHDQIGHVVARHDFIEADECEYCAAVVATLRRVDSLEATLRHVSEWARGRQKLADDEAEQGGEEFSDIARRCEEVIRARGSAKGETA